MRPLLLTLAALLLASCIPDARAQGIGGGGLPFGGAGIGGAGTNAGPIALPSGDAIEFGRTIYGTDYAALPSAPSSGAIVSMWTRILETTPSGYPWARGNMETFAIGDGEWYLRCIVGNIGITDANNATYNANTMLFAELDGDHSGDWVNDYTYYNGAHTETEVRGWVWVAWQVVVEASQFRFRQWLKMGASDDVFAAGDTTLTFAAVRSVLTGTLGWSAGDATAWTPGPPTWMHVGHDQGPAYLWHVRVDEGSAEPSLAALEAISDATAFDSGAWADWPLVWHGGAADIDDGSGHARDLTVQGGGTLYDGIARPF